VTAGLSIVVLAGWGLLVMAMTFRAFAWLGMRAVGKRGGGMGLVRLLVGVSSFLLITQGARVIASLLHRSQSMAIFLSLLAAAAFLVYRGLRDTRRNMTLTRPLPVRDLGRALGVQVALLPLYGFYAFVGAAASPSSPAWGAFALMGSVWLLVALLLIIWWGEGRVGLIRRAFIWGP